jgi:hypothetical protein
MKQLGLIKWIIGLRERDRFWVIMLIAISALWTQNLVYKREAVKMQEKNDQLRQIIIVRADSCEAQKIRIYLNQLINAQKTQAMVDSLARENLFTISKNNNNIKVVKKSQ